MVTAFGFRHQLLNVNSVQLEELAAGEPPFPLAQVAPVATTDTVGGLRRLAEQGRTRPSACNLLTATGDAHEFPPPVTPAYMEEAARQAGFVVTTQWSLPDGRVVSLWRRPATCPGGPEADCGAASAVGHPPVEELLVVDGALAAEVAAVVEGGGQEADVGAQ